MYSSVIVIGGGISGTAAAYELARRGVSVTLLERDALASMASGWTLAGVRQSGRHPAELPLAQAAVTRWAGLADELGADVEYRREGNLRIALNETDVPTIRDVVATGIAAGIPMSYLDGADAVRQVAPALTTDLAGASLCPTDGHANPHLTVAAYAAAARREGATLRTGVEVTAIQTDGSRVTGVMTTNGAIACKRVVLAGGVYSPYLLDPLGIRLPLSIVHVPAVQTVPMPPMLSQVLGVASGGFAGRQEASGRFRLTGFSNPWNETWHDDDNVQPTTDQMRHTIEWATRLLPAVSHARVAQVWGGLIDKTPDALPVIERTPEIDGLIVAAGFSGHGFCLGPVTGEILADLATKGTTAYPIAPFNRARLDDARIPEEVASRVASGVTLHG